MNFKPIGETIAEAAAESMMEQGIEINHTIIKQLTELSEKSYLIGRQHELESNGPVAQCTLHGKTALFCMGCMREAARKAQ